MEVQRCNPYHARLGGRSLLTMGDDRSVFKLYYIDIVGRENRARYEWDHSPVDRLEFETELRAKGIEGTGFITAFPHITKVFRYAPSAETVVHVTAFNTADFSAIDLQRVAGWVEFACYAEAVIAADEYGAWAEARTVEEYLSYLSDFAYGPVVSESKLRTWWTNG